MQWTSELQQYAYDLFTNGLPYESVARMIEQVVGHPVTAEQVRMAVRRFRKSMALHDTTLSRQVSHDQVSHETAAAHSISSYTPSSYTPPTITADHVLVCADLHVPHHSEDMIAKLHAVAQTYHVDTLIIAGDLYNFDSLSSWPPIAPTQSSFEDELHEVGQVLDDLGGTFRHIHILTGNHELRFLRRIQTYTSLQTIVSMSIQAYPSLSRRTTITAYPTTYMIVGFSSQRWLIGHLPHTSRRRGEVARMLAERYRMNVAGGHDHVQGVAMSQDGMFIGISIGCMVHLDQRGHSSLWYAESKLSTYPQMQQGFLRLDNGAPILYTAHGLSCLNGGHPWSVVLPKQQDTQAPCYPNNVMPKQSD